MSILEEALPEELREAMAEIAKDETANKAEFKNDFLYDVWVHPDWHGRMSDALWFKEASGKYRESMLGWIFGRLNTS